MRNISIISYLISADCYYRRMTRKLNKTWIALGFLVLLLVDTYARPSVESESGSEEDEEDDDEDYELVTYSSDTNFLKMLKNTILYLDQFVQKFIKPHLDPNLPSGHKPEWVAPPSKKPEQGSKPTTKPTDKTTQKPAKTTSKPAPKPVEEPITTTTTTPKPIPTTIPTTVPTTIPTTSPTTTPTTIPVPESPKPVEVVEVAVVEVVKSPVDPPADLPVEIPLDPVDVGENLVDTPLEKPSAKSTEKPIEKPTEHPLEKSTTKPEKEKPVLSCHNCTIHVTCSDCVQFKPPLVSTDPTIMSGQATTLKPSASMKFLIPDMLAEELERNEADMMDDTTGSSVVPGSSVSITENAMPEADVIPAPETLPPGEPASPVGDMSQQPIILPTADEPVLLEANPVLPSATPSESVAPSGDAAPEAVLASEPEAIEPVPSSATIELGVPSEQVAPLEDGAQLAAKPEVASADSTATDSAIPESAAPLDDVLPEALPVAMREVAVEPVLPSEPTVPSEVVASSGVEAPETVMPAATETDAMLP